MGNAIMESGLARELARARSGGMALYEVEHSYAGMKLMHDAVLRALPEGITDREMNLRWIGTDPDEDWFELYYEWMTTGDRRLFLCKGDRVMWVGHTMRPNESGPRWRDMPSEDYRVIWYSPDNNPMGAARNRHQYEIGCGAMPSKPSRINMATWRKFDAAWRTWCERVLRRDDRRMDNKTFVGLAGSQDVDRRIDAAMNATHENLYVCMRESLPLFGDPDIRVRVALAKNKWVGACFLRRSSEDPDWRVRLAVCIGMTRQSFNNISLPNSYMEVVAPLASDPEYEVRLAAAELLYHDKNESRNSFSHVLDSPYDDDFKAIMTMARMR